MLPRSNLVSIVTIPVLTAAKAWAAPSVRQCQVEQASFTSRPSGIVSKQRAQRAPQFVDTST